MKAINNYLTIILLCLLFLSCAREDTRLRNLSGGIFGTTYNIKYLAHPHSPPQEEVERAILDRLSEVDAIMSNWNPTSEITRLNEHPVGEAIQINADLVKLLELSINVQKGTLGAFDISVGPLVSLWGFDGYIPETSPTPEQINEARARMGIEYLGIDFATSEVTKNRDLQLVLGAIAKGYGVDELGDVLLELGIDNYLVEIGGEVLSHGSRRNDGWRVAVEQPDELLRKPFDVFVLRNQAMATSGDYRDYYEKDGIRYSHIIDPASGYPVSHRLASVSVIHESTTIADAWATGLFVLGATKGLKVANDSNIAAYFIERRDEGFVAIMSDEFKRLTETK